MVGGCPKCRLPASSQGLWQRAVFRSLPWTSAQNPSQLQGDQKTSIFTVQQHYARHEIVYSQWPRGFSISWWFVQRRGVGESGSWCWAWGQFAGNGSGCGKMPHHPFLCLFSNLLPVNHFPAHPVKIVTQFKACTVWAECKKYPPFCLGQICTNHFSPSWLWSNPRVLPTIIICWDNWSHCSVQAFWGEKRHLRWM